MYAKVEHARFDPGTPRSVFRDRYIGTLLRPRAPTLFAAAILEDDAVAVGEGVAQGEWLCVQCIGTLAAHRRQGAARAILSALGRWGSEQGCQNAYLAVTADNWAAQALYRNLGFETVDGYAYLVRG